jgi:hypothetical protein
MRELSFIRIAAKRINLAQDSCEFLRYATVHTSRLTLFSLIFHSFYYPSITFYYPMADAPQDTVLFFSVLPPSLDHVPSGAKKEKPKPQEEKREERIEEKKEENRIEEKKEKDELNLFEDDADDTQYEEDLQKRKEAALAAKGMKRGRRGEGRRGEERKR